MVTKVKAPATWYNYLYMFPDDTVFYVGKGQKGRIDEHEKEAQTGCPCEKCRTIRFIWKCRQPVKKRIVFETLVESEALENEKKLIVRYASEFLTNIVHNHYEKAAKVEAEKFSSLSGLALTIENVMKEWEPIRKMIKSRGDGHKIAAILAWFKLIAVEGTKEIPVVVIQANTDIYHKAIQSSPIYCQIIEWAMESVMKQKCKLHCLEPSCKI